MCAHVFIRTFSFSNTFFVCIYSEIRCDVRDVLINNSVIIISFGLCFLQNCVNFRVRLQAIKQTFRRRRKRYIMINRLRSFNGVLFVYCASLVSKLFFSESQLSMCVCCAIENMSNGDTLTSVLGYGRRVVWATKKKIIIINKTPNRFILNLPSTRQKILKSKKGICSMFILLIISKRGSRYLFEGGEQSS